MSVDAAQLARFVATLSNSSVTKRTREEMAAIYSDLIIIDQTASVNWREVNEMIIEEWSMSGLIYIKTLAWKRFHALEQEHQHDHQK